MAGVMTFGAPRVHLAPSPSRLIPACGAISDRVSSTIEAVAFPRLVCGACLEYLEDVRVTVKLRELKALRELALRHEEEFQAIYAGGIASLVESEYRRVLGLLLDEQT